jgi:hypothetical protein
MECAMPKFLITYHGAREMPPTAEARDQMMSAFMAWAGGVGDHMVDPGSPLGASRVISSAGDADEHGDSEGPGEILGYTILTADTLDEAAELVRSHPFLSRGGTLRVSESVAP